jgi:hypothetical protein
MTKSDSDPPTQRLCPACGFSPDGRPLCRICHGTGLVTPDQIAAWIGQRRQRQSTTQFRISAEVNQALAEVRARRTQQTAPLVTLGEALAKRLDAGEVSQDLAIAVSDWLDGVRAIQRGDR